MREMIIILLTFAMIAGCVRETYTSEPIRTTPNTIPPKTEQSVKEAENINLIAEGIEKEEPKFKPEVQEIKNSTAVIIVKQNEIKAESIVHEQESKKVVKKLQKLDIVVKELQDVERTRKLDEARNIKYGVIALFALTTVGFLAYGHSIPGTGFTMLGAVMAGTTVATSIAWSQLEQHPILVTGLSVLLVIGAAMMYLVKREKNSDPLGFG